MRKITEVLRLKFAAGLVYQDIQAMHRMRPQVVTQRTALVNQVPRVVGGIWPCDAARS
jgi:hypothetical protein